LLSTLLPREEVFSMFRRVAAGSRIHRVQAVMAPFVELSLAAEG